MKLVSFPLPRFVDCYVAAVGGRKKIKRWVMSKWRGVRVKFHEYSPVALNLCGTDTRT